MFKSRNSYIVSTTSQRYTGFTLAEVLITLAIIGVVAAMSIPALMKNTNKMELKTGLKTANAILSQAVKRMATEEGGQLLKTYNGKHGTFKPKFIKYFNITKDCNNADCVTGITPSSVYKIFSKSRGINMGTMDEGQFVLNNGMTVFIQNSSVIEYGILIAVDINGHHKAPNLWGHDLFSFELMDDDSLKPCGAPDTGLSGHFNTGFANNQLIYCNPNGTSELNGIGCTAKALMDPDYWNTLP